MKTLYHGVIVSCSESGLDGPHAIEVHADEDGRLYLVVADSPDRGRVILSAWCDRNAAIEAAVMLATAPKKGAPVDERIAWLEGLDGIEVKYGHPPVR